MQNKAFEEAELGRLAMRAGRARGHVERDHAELSEARLDIAAFGVELPALEAAAHLVGGLAAVQGDAAVALLFRERVAGLEHLQAMELRIEIDLLALHLLQAHHVGALAGEPAEQPLACRRANAVDVKGDDPQDAAGKAETPPCAADHLAGAWRKASTSAICSAPR